MFSIVQKFMRTKAFSLSGLFSRARVSRQQELLYIADDVEVLGVVLQEMSEHELFRKTSVSQQVKEKAEVLTQKVEDKLSASVTGKVVKEAIPKTQSAIQQQIDAVKLEFAHGQAEKEPEVKVPVW